MSDEREEPDHAPCSERFHRLHQARATEDRFRVFLESAPDAMVIVDDTGAIQLVNAQTEAVFGYRREELLGRPVEILVPHRFRGRHAAHRHHYADNRQVRPMGAGLELYGLRKDGHEFPVEISLSPLETPDGLLFSAAVRDVSERKTAEERINELAALVESSQDAILVKTLEGRITYWNTAAQQLYGYSSDEAVGRHVSFLVPPEYKDEVSALLRRLGRGEKVGHFEAVRMASNGDLLDVDITLGPTYDAGGTVVGAYAIVRDISERKRAEAELTRLYEQQRHVALTLQRSLMGTPPEVPGLHTASRYLPATQGAGVGGDWFDLVPLGGGQVGILIGDVMGRGLEAAAVMGQLRSAANALARTGMPPGRLMQALDTIVADLPDQLVTCCYVVIAPDEGKMTICSAGHLPVLLATPGHDVRPMDAPVSVPLGVGDIPHRQAVVDVRAGSTLALYTDGLVETPDTDIEQQIRTLAWVLQTAFESACGLEAAADHALATLLPNTSGHNDDVTLLLVQLPPAPLASASTELPSEPGAAAAGRRFVAEALTTWNCSEALDDARLLTSEVLTNALSHAAGPIQLRVRRSIDALTIEVTDHNPQPPQLRLTEEGDESGRGLLLVDALADSWGTRPLDRGKTIWFTLRLPQHPAP
ncbi:PAS domain S-box protein [Streptomyces sp. NPDC020379]|uniref:PAS domain S-box protein n=1 Tax=Streptomyces sp. NPDC020379 TaxID=3365071 RepID=UPI0037A746AE